MTVTVAVFASVSFVYEPPMNMMLYIGHHEFVAADFSCNGCQFQLLCIDEKFKCIFCNVVKLRMVLF